MKQYLFILCLILSTTIMAQVTPATYQDTANYLNNEIAAKKSLFIGKPFSVLLDSLKIMPVNLTLSAPPSDSLKGHTATLDFNYSTKFKQSHYLLIEWQNPLPWNTYAPIVREGFSALKALYASVIIKDIEIKDYGQPDPDDDLVY
ncbi:hypothetical protein ACLOAU_04180 [Niabella sp. CJ426]|uniref:hypothetical protein n=1 Tax=Niabella sp. CJ426 TaxID=3393740 RepID=UPI003D05A964